MNVKTILLLVVGISYADHQCSGGSYLETHDNGESYIWNHQRCPVGEFAPLNDCLVNQNPCRPCPYGFYQNQTGQTSCLSMTQTNCSNWPRYGLRMGATDDKCFFCENASFQFVYQDERCYLCGERYLWTRDKETNQTSCQKINPFDGDYFKVLFALSIIFLAVITYLIDQIKFQYWCWLAGVTLNILVSTLYYYDTDISEEESIKWLSIGFLIEIACIGVFIFFKHCLSQKDIVAPQPEGGEKQVREQEIVCFE